MTQGSNHIDTGCAEQRSADRATTREMANICPFLCRGLSRFVAVWRGLSRKTRGCIHLMARTLGRGVRRLVRRPPQSFSRVNLAIDCASICLFLS
jgi:hypothetical protein